MLYLQTKKLTFAPDESAPMAKERPFDTIFDAHAWDIPTLGACLKENRYLATVILSEEFKKELRMVAEIVSTFCEPTRLPHNLDNINYCIEQRHKSTE